MRLDLVGRAGRGARVFRRVDGIRLRESVEERVPLEPERAVQEHDGRAAAGDLDVGVDLPAPGGDGAVLRGDHHSPPPAATGSRAGKSPFGAQALRPPAVLPFVVPDVADVGEDFAGEEVDVLERQLVRHRADVQEHHQVADAQVLDRLLKPIADRRRAAGDDEALLDEVLEREVRQLVAHAAHVLELLLHRVHEAPVVLVAGRRSELRRDVQALVVEVADVRVVLLLGAGVRLGDDEELQEAGAVGVRVAIRVADELPEAVHDTLRELAAEVAEEAVAVVVLDREVPGAEAAAARDPDGRVRLLDGPRPEVDEWAAGCTCR